jgi:hypothetical protein
LEKFKEREDRTNKSSAFWGLFGFSSRHHLAGAFFFDILEAGIEHLLRRLTFDFVHITLVVLIWDCPVAALCLHRRPYTRIVVITDADMGLLGIALLRFRAHSKSSQAPFVVADVGLDAEAPVLGVLASTLAFLMAVV